MGGLPEKRRSMKSSVDEESSHQVPSAPTNVTVLTYNVGNGMAEPALLTSMLFDSEAEIVGLQELSVPQARAIETDLGQTYPYRLLMPTGFSGKGLLSKFPIQSSGSIGLAPDRPDLGGQVLVNGRSVQIIVAHPRPPRITRNGAKFDEATANQVKAIGAMAVDDPPAIVLGDFNMTHRQELHAHLISLGLRDAFQALDARGATFPSRVGHPHRVGELLSRLPLRPMLRIDYVWVTPEFEVVDAWIGFRAGSDHLPVLARLAWSEAAVSEDAREDQ
jgi:vancomycin resistance protein VanJ